MADERSEQAPEPTRHPARTICGALALTLGAGLLIVENAGGVFGIEPGRVAQAILAAALVLTGFVALLKPLNDKLAGRNRRVVLAVDAGVLTVLAAAGLGIYATREDTRPPIERMDGVQDVALVGFAPAGEARNEMLREVSHSLAGAVEDRFRERWPKARVHDYAREVQAPLTDLPEEPRARMEDWTAEFVATSGAEIVLSGVVRVDSADRTVIEPMMYVRADQAPEAPELAGWYAAAGTIATDRPLGSPTGRYAVVEALAQAAEDLLSFTGALDAFAAGRLDEASSALEGLRARTSSVVSFVSPDLVRLFSGHVRQFAALRGPPDEQQRGLLEARAQYQAIPEHSGIRKRADLSLAGNTYLRSIGVLCRPGTADGEELRHAADTVRRLSTDPTFSEIGRLKAAVDLAQIEQCRQRSGLTAESGAVTAAVEVVKSAPAPSGVPQEVLTELRNLAVAIEAQHLADQGRFGEAVVVMRPAVDGERSSGRRAIRLGLISSWLLRQCQIAGARAAGDEALDELDRAIAQRAVDPQRRTVFETALAAETGQYEHSCMQERRTHDRAGRE